MCSTTMDIIPPSGLCAALQWIEHMQRLYAHWSMRSTTVDRTSTSCLCAAPQWIEHLQVLNAQYHSG